MEVKRIQHHILLKDITYVDAPVSEIFTEICISKGAFYDLWTRLPEMAFAASLTDDSEKHCHSTLVAYIRSLSYYVDMLMGQALQMPWQLPVDVIEDFCQRFGNVATLSKTDPRKFVRALFELQVLFPAEEKAFRRCVDDSKEETLRAIVKYLLVTLGRLFFAKDFMHKGTFKQNVLFPKFVDLRVLFLEYDWNKIIGAL